MQYSVAHFEYHFAEEWQQAVFEQQLADIGFDSFDGEDAYIVSQQLDQAALESLADATEGVRLVSVERCPDNDWNATWEQEHALEVLACGVQIRPRCAFGAGHHQTTRMMTEALQEGAEGNSPLLSPRGRRVLDMGCGTGVLGITAAKLGAEEVVGIDIDENSVANTQENAALNEVSITVLQGSTPPVATDEGERFDLIMANIHRNILLAQLPAYARLLRKGGQVWLSGFYEEDAEVLIEAAQRLGLRLVSRRHIDEWQAVFMESGER